MLLCSACRQKKPEECFNVNRSSKRGRDCYCTNCRSAYYKGGRGWPNARERAERLLAEGLWRCSCCKQELPTEQFYKSESYRYGVSDYCRNCTSRKGKAKSGTPEARAKRREYHSRPDVAARTEAWKRATPRNTLSVRLNAALKRRPTTNPVTLDELLQMWRDQDGLCLVSGLEMTWRGGVATPTSISIDRKDCGLGYTRDSVRLVCLQVNVFKGRWSDEQMLEMAQAIVSHAEGR